MQELLSRRPLKRRRLFQKRPHPDIEFFFSRQHDQAGHGTDGPDDGVGADSQDPGNPARSRERH
jgi:hypothetical protein